MKALFVLASIALFARNAISSLPQTLVAIKDNRYGIVSPTGSVFTLPVFTSLDRLDNNCYWVSCNPTNDFSGQVVSQSGKPLCEPAFLLYDDPIFHVTPPVLTNGVMLLSANGMGNKFSHDFLLYLDGQMVDLGIQLWHYLNNQGIVSRRLSNGKICLFDVATRKNGMTFDLDNILDSGLPNVVIGYESGKFGLMDIAGKDILPCSYDSISHLYYSKGLFVASKDGSRGLFSLDNGWILPLSKAASFDTEDFGRLFKVKIRDDNFVLDSHTGKRIKLPAGATIGETAWSSFTYIRNSKIYIGILGKIDAFPFTNSSVVLKSKTSGFYGCGDIWEIKENDKTISSVYVYHGKAHYYENERIAESLCVIPKRKCLFLVITETNSKRTRIVSVDSNTTIVPTFDSKDFMVYAWKDKICIRNYKTNSFSIIDLSGKILVDFSDKISFAEGGYFGLEDYTCVIHGGKSGLIDSECRFVLPCQYEDVGHYGEGLVPAKQGGKWGFVELPGKWAIPPRFEEARSFKNGFAPVRVNNKWGFIGKDGKPATPFFYEDVKDVRESHFRAQVNGKWGIFALDGTCTLPAEYDKIIASDEPEYGDPR